MPVANSKAATKAQGQGRDCALEQGSFSDLLDVVAAGPLATQNTVYTHSGDDQLTSAMMRSQGEMKNDELHLRLMTSQTETMTLDEFVRVLRFRTVLLFYLAPLVVLVLTDARSSQGLPQWKNAAVYLAGTTSFLLTVMVVVTLARRLSKTPGPLSLHMTPVLMVGALVSNIVGETMVVALGGTGVSFPWGALALYVFFWLVAEAGFAFAAGLVIPAALAEMRAAKPPADAALAATPPTDRAARIAVGGYDLDPEDLLWIRAHGTHVRIALHDRELNVLFTFPTLVALLPTATGMQVHRGIWVARRAIRGFVRDGRDLQLVLTDGTALPVASSRQAEVMAWLRQSDGTAPKVQDLSVAPLH